MRGLAGVRGGSPRRYAERVDVIGSASPADEPRRPPPDELHLDWDGEPGSEPDDVPPPRGPLADIFSTEALAIAALTVGAAALAGLSSLSYLLFESYGLEAPAPRQQMYQRSSLYGLAAVLTLLLALGGLLRRPVAEAQWARRLAGAAVLLGLVLAGIALLFLQRSGTAPESYPTA
jgi:hypothetical protein